MKIHVLSDLHLEFAPFDVPATDADVVVLAGDTNLGVRGIEWAMRSFAKPVLYVAGNHEFYKHHWIKLPDELRSVAQGSNVHFLEDEEIIIAGVRFLGCSLWTDFALFGDDQRHDAMMEAERRMTDYRKIRAPRVRPGFKDDYSKLKPIQTVERFRRSRAFLKEKLAVPFDGRTVVVTHHLPARQSLPAWYADSLISAAYASDLTSVMRDHGPDVWVHGHVHGSSNYTFGSTRIICNPRGYWLPKREFENASFNPNLVIEV